MTESLDALRQAAATLLAAASPGAVLAATRALLADWDENTLPAAAAGPPQAVRHSDEAVETTWAASAAAPKSDEIIAWEDLRQRVREARQARGVSIQTLAEQLGMAKTTLENALQCSALPSTPTRTRLTAWLAAPEVAVDATEQFRPNGTDHHDDQAARLDDDGTDQLAA
jgi:ribosome-binding protein aMBF1 (putative translation factor)